MTPLISSLSSSNFPTKGRKRSVQISVASTAFSNGGALTSNFRVNTNGCTGANDSPQLSWSASGDTDIISYWRLRCIDPQGGNFVHWSVDKIPVTTVSIAANGTWPVGVQTNISGWGAPFSRVNGWGGPCPPAGSGTHNYTFIIQAINDTSGGAIVVASGVIVGTDFR